MHIFVGFDKFPVQVEPNDTFLRVREKSSINGNFLFILDGEIILEENSELSEFPIEDGTFLELKKVEKLAFGRYRVFFVDGECIGDINVLRNISDQMFEMMLICDSFFYDDDVCLSLERTLNDIDKTTSFLKYANTYPEKMLAGRENLVSKIDIKQVVIERIRDYLNLYKRFNGDRFQEILDQLIELGNLSDEDKFSIVNSSYRVGTIGIKLVTENSTLSRFINDSRVVKRCITNGDIRTFIDIVNFLSLSKLLEIRDWVMVTNGSEMFIQMIEQNMLGRTID